MLEKELKVLNVDVTTLTQKLRDIGAELTYDGHIFDIKFHNPHETHRLKIRLRKKADSARLTFKARPKQEEDGIKVREEYEYKVDRWETYDALSRTNLVPKRTKFKHRTSFRCDQIAFDIDQYPSLPPLLEIEAPDKETIFERVEKLALQEHQQLTCGTKGLFKHYGHSKLTAYA